MSRKRRPARRDARPQPPAGAGPVRPAGRAPGGRFAWWVAAIVLAGAAAFFALRTRPASTPAAAGAAALAPEVAYARAVELGNAGRWRESLEFYQRALSGAPGNSCEARVNYASSLHNITIDYIRRAGHSATMARSSVERVELEREAMAQMEHAAQIAPDGRTGALVLTRLANMQMMWGLRWETLRSLQAAAGADPSNPGLARRAETFREMLRDPTGFSLVQSDVDAIPSQR